jgi:dUTP pyrophosphatase
VEIEIVIEEGAKCPRKSSRGASGYDVYAKNGYTIGVGQNELIKTGIKLAVPEGYECQIRGRSGLAKQGIMAHFGTIDSDYRGEICAILYNTTQRPYTIEKGDRIGQLVFSRIYNCEFTPVFELKETERGTGGFGSTGK